MQIGNMPEILFHIPVTYPIFQIRFRALVKNAFPYDCSILLFNCLNQLFILQSIIRIVINPVTMSDFIDFTDIFYSMINDHISFTLAEKKSERFVILW